MIGELLKQLFPALGRFIAYHLLRPFHRGHESGKLVWLPDHGVTHPENLRNSRCPYFGIPPTPNASTN